MLPCEAEKEILIQNKIREIAVAELVSEGKMDITGKLVKEINGDIDSE